MEQLGYRILSPFFVLLCLGGARLNIRFNLCFEQPSSFYLNTNSFLTIDPPPLFQLKQPKSLLPQ